MKNHRMRVERPLWVKVGLWGLPNRASAWVFFWLSIILVLGSLVLGVWDPRFFAGIFLLLAALWYWLSIQWVDEHDDWD